MAKIFRLVVEGDTDSNKDGNPDVSVDAQVFGFQVFKGKQDLSPGQAMSLFGALVEALRRVLPF